MVYRKLFPIVAVALSCVAAPAAHAQVNSEKLFNWVEDSFPSYLSPRRPATQALPPYVYRAYGGTSTYLAVSTANNHLYFLSTATGLVDLGDASAIPLPVVDLELCNDAAADPQVHQAPITCVGPTNVFSSADTDKRNNVWVVMRFPAREGGYHWRLLMTQNTPDGRMEQDRTVIPSSTHTNISSSFAVATPGTYCLTLLDSFEETKKFSSTSCFEVR